MQVDLNAEEVPQIGLARTLEDLSLNSHISETVTRLKANVSRKIIESGSKAVIKIDWDGDDLTNRINLSVRAGTVAFIGNPHQFVRLNGEEINDVESVENALAASFNNPLILKKTK